MFYANVTFTVLLGTSCIITTSVASEKTAHAQDTHTIPKDFWSQSFSNPHDARRLLSRGLEIFLEVVDEAPLPGTLLTQADIKNYPFCDVLDQEFSKNELGNYHHAGKEIRFIRNSSNASTVMRAWVGKKYYYIDFNQRLLPTRPCEELRKDLLHEIGHLRNNHSLHTIAYEVARTVTGNDLRAIVGAIPPNLDMQEQEANQYAITRAPTADLPVLENLWHERCLKEKKLSEYYDYPDYISNCSLHKRVVTEMRMRNSY